jgi:hypothetical protein
MIEFWKRKTKSYTRLTETGLFLHAPSLMPESHRPYQFCTRSLRVALVLDVFNGLDPNGRVRACDHVIQIGCAA